MTRQVRPSCFIIMPFGIKEDMDGRQYDFDKIYKALIEPAVSSAGLEAIRADEETVNGIIHKPMYERLILCDYALADLTTSNANVFYELGVRHAVKPFTTLTIFASDSKLPFDVNFLRCMPYQYDDINDNAEAEKAVLALTRKLNAAKKEKTTDSPLYQLVNGIQFQNSVAHEKTDIFHEKVLYDESLKNELSKIRNMKAEIPVKTGLLDAFINQQKPLENLEAGVLVDIMLTYRSLELFYEMVTYIGLLPLHLQQTTMVMEQKAFALNRLKTPEARAEAISILEEVLKKQGPGSETYGLLGRIYKDIFIEALADDNSLMAASYLEKALDMYTKGFYADWRDAYPGVNMLTLMALTAGQEHEIEKLAPVVTFAVERKMERKAPDYWDYATLMEISVIVQDFEKVQVLLIKMMAAAPEKWMVKTTINNLKLLSQYRKQATGKTDTDAIAEQLKPYA